MPELEEALNNMNLNEFQQGYLAAMIDGEGCIYITKVKNKHLKSGFEYHWRVEIANTAKQVIDYCFSITGGYVYINKRGETRAQKNRKPVWKIKYGLEEGKELLSILLPNLQRKRQQAELLLSYLNIFGGRTHFPEDSRDAVVNMKEVFCRKMHQLNHVGPHGPACPCMGESQK